MASYQNIGKPRFWIPITPYLAENNMLTVSGIEDQSATFDWSNATELNKDDVSRLIGLDPNNFFSTKLDSQNSTNDIRIDYTFTNNNWLREGDNYFAGIVGHNISKTESGAESANIHHMEIMFDDNRIVGPFSGIEGTAANYNMNAYINSEGFDRMYPYYEGTSLVEFVCPILQSDPESLTPKNKINLYMRQNVDPDTLSSNPFYDNNEDNSNITIGSFIIGKCYDSRSFNSYPNADLSLEFKRNYNYSRVETERGLSYSNSHYMKNPNAMHFQLDDYIGTKRSLFVPPTSRDLHGRSDLREWELSFSTMKEVDALQEHHSVHTLQDNGELIGLDMLHSMGWGIPADEGLHSTQRSFEQMLNYTMGNSLPFILQLDEDNFMPDSFAICRFKESSFKFERTSVDRYRVSIGIVEEF